MIFSHGEKHRFIGNDGEPAFTMADIALLAHRKSFVYACWTAVQLGKTAAKQPNCWYAGYNNAVITGGSDIPNEMQQIFRFIKNNFYALRNKQEIDLFLQTLSDLCNQIEEYYLEKYPESLDYIGIATTLRNIWAKLEIWTANEKFAHPEAIEAPLW